MEVQSWGSEFYGLATLPFGGGGIRIGVQIPEADMVPLSHYKCLTGELVVTILVCSKDPLT